jgi:hypothetical protein
MGGEEELSDCSFTEETITGGDNQAAGGNKLRHVHKAWESKPRAERRKVRCSPGNLLKIQKRIS